MVSEVDLLSPCLSKPREAGVKVAAYASPCVGRRQLRDMTLGETMCWAAMVMAAQQGMAGVMQTAISIWPWTMVSSLSLP